MTVQQLVEILQALPGNKEVMFRYPSDSDGIPIEAVEFDERADTIYLKVFVHPDGRSAGSRAFSELLAALEAFKGIGHEKAN